MERATFLIEGSSERLSCMLNPASLALRRVAGLRPLRSIAGHVSGRHLSDDRLLATGGGSTELDLDLLFDTTLAGSTVQSEDVRDLTGPLWELCENANRPSTGGGPPRVRFVWGKAWNFPAVVVAVAERFEHFTAGGVPRRSWLRLKLRRVEDAEGWGAAERAGAGAGTEPRTHGGRSHPSEVGAEATVPAASQEDAVAATGRLDLIAAEQLGDASLWRLLAEYNGLESPFELELGAVLRIPRGTFP